jgi:hypothetical protein
MEEKQDNSKYNGKPSINILAIENEQGKLEKYHVWFYHNPNLGGITSSTFLDTANDVIQYIQKNQDDLDKNPDKSKRTTSKFRESELENLLSKGKSAQNQLIKTSDGRIKVNHHFYRENILN